MHFSSILRKPGHLARKKVLRHFIRDTHDLGGTVFLAGSGRSGTTWISEIINHDNAFRLIFEPFHTEHVPVMQHFRFRQYLRPVDDDPRFLNSVRDVLTGRLRTEWSDAYNMRLRADRRLIKAIRANLLLKWMHVHFPEVPLVLVLRHPCAVAWSKTRLGWDTHLDVLLEQEALVEDHLQPFVSLLEETRDPFEAHVLLWCVEYFVPLRQFASAGRVHVAFYEQFCVDPRREVERLFDFLGRRPTDAAMERVRRPSRTTRKKSAVRTGEDLVGNWQRNVTAARSRRARELLADFGLDALYTEAPLPHVTDDGTRNPFAVTSPSPPPPGQSEQ